MLTPDAVAAPEGGDGSPPSLRQEKMALLEKEKEREGRARAMASVIELRYMTSASGRSKSEAGSKSELMRSRRQKVTVADFDLLTIIGRGAFGEVRLCRERRSNQVFAMKTMSKAQLVGQGKVAHVWAERCAMAEAAYMSPWLIQLHHAWCSAEHVYLVMDYLPGGDLMSGACHLTSGLSAPALHALFFALAAVLASRRARVRAGTGLLPSCSVR